MLPEQAGKQPWTENGLELLRLIKNEINNCKVTDNQLSKEADFLHACNKNECYFCEYLNLIPAKKSKQIDEIKQRQRFFWLPAEHDIMLKYLFISIKELEIKLPNRNRNAIKFKRHYIAKQLGYIFIKNKWVPNAI